MKFSTSKRSWRSLSLAAVLTLLFGLLLAACGDSTTASTGSTTTAAGGSTPAGGTTATTAAGGNTTSNGAATTVTFWGDWTGEGEKQVLVMVDAFNKSQSNIVVKYIPQEDITTKFLTASTSGAAPDLVIWDRFKTALYAPKGVLLPLDDLIAQDKINKADYYDQALKELTVGGKTYGLPMTVDARALFYNKKLLADAGVKPPTTWDELKAAAEKLTVREGDKITRVGLSLQDVGLFNMYLQQAGGSMLNADGTKTNFNTPEGQAVLKLWGDLVSSKSYQFGFEDGLGKDQDAFVTGKVAMMYTGPWMISTYKKYGKDLDFGVVPPPAGPKGDKGGVMGGFGLAIPKAGKQQKAAWEFMKWWLNTPENAVTWGKTSQNIPANLKAIQDPAFQGDPIIKPIIDTLSFAKIRPQYPSYEPMEGEALIPNLQLFMQGKQNATDTLKKAQEAGDRVITENSTK